jgi:hypothetical protein
MVCWKDGAWTCTWLDEGKEGVRAGVSTLSARVFIASEPRSMAQRGEARRAVESDWNLVVGVQMQSGDALHCSHSWLLLILQHAIVSEGGG